jgi:hypothetical protein
MHRIDYAIIEKMQLNARRERSRFIYCQFRRLVLWIRARLPHADDSLKSAACC